MAVMGEMAVMVVPPNHHHHHRPTHLVAVDPDSATFLEAQLFQLGLFFFMLGLLLFVLSLGACSSGRSKSNTFAPTRNSTWSGLPGSMCCQGQMA